VVEEGRRERTDQVGFERRAAISTDPFCSFGALFCSCRASVCSVCSGLYARILEKGNRGFERSACRRDVRQRKHTVLDMLNHSISPEVQINPCQEEYPDMVTLQIARPCSFSPNCIHQFGAYFLSNPGFHGRKCL
jgi:hypothetical protein